MSEKKEVLEAVADAANNLAVRMYSTHDRIGMYIATAFVDFAQELYREASKMDDQQTASIVKQPTEETQHG